MGESHKQDDKAHDCKGESSPMMDKQNTFQEGRIFDMGRVILWACRAPHQQQ